MSERSSSPSAEGSEAPTTAPSSPPDTERGKDSKTNSFDMETVKNDDVSTPLSPHKPIPTRAKQAVKEEEDNDERTSDTQEKNGTNELSTSDEVVLERMKKEEKEARADNTREELKRRREVAIKRRQNREDADEVARKAKAAQLEELLDKSEAFSNILTKKTQVLGRVGSGLDGKALGEHDLVMAKQPSIMKNGTMRDYQLEGLTWMYEICAQGMSGILADEMGLGKTIQTISLIALLREQEGYLGPHLIIAPLSTLSNWMNEFAKWTPSVPVVLYHGTPPEREEIREKQMLKNLKNGKPTGKFPVVCTSYDIILRDKTALAKINWELIIIDEGHRMKNSNSKLFRELLTFTSATRLLITGTPLQNNLKELWSLLHFLLPHVFTDWEAFESWFDFGELKDEERTEEFIADKKKLELIAKIHRVLQPLLLRRVKADVEHMLPKKREYVLYAPMTQEQTELYNVINDKNADPRKYLEGKVAERLTGGQNTPSVSRKSSLNSMKSRKSTKKKAIVADDSGSESDTPLISARGRKSKADPTAETPKSANAFERLMGSRPSSIGKTATPKIRAGAKRKSTESVETPNKSAKSSRASTPATTSNRTRSGRKTRKTVIEAPDASDEDLLSDDEFEQRLAEELAAEEDSLEEDSGDEEERQKMRTLDQAKKEISAKKLGNPLMQLRLVCNSPHNFYNPWSADANLEIDESIVSTSGKMLLLDRLLPVLFAEDHKVLIFSQFKTQLDILEDYIHLREWPVCRIDGTVKQDDRRQQIEDFNADSDYKVFLLSTRAGGQGINLASADTVILFDSDWNPQQDLQAIDRAHRIGQTRPVIIYRLATKGTVEETLLLSAGAKRRLEKLVIKKGGFRTMGQKMDKKEEMAEEDLRNLLLRDGEVFEYKGGDEILSEEEMGILTDRSESAYLDAERGLGDAARFKIVETKIEGLVETMKREK